MDELRYYFFPYGMARQDDGSWVLFNRRYKPIGFKTNEFIRYETHPVSFKLKRTDKRTLRKLSYRDEPPDEPFTQRVFFYNDSCIPTNSADAMKSYLEKLEILMSLKCE